MSKKLGNRGEMVAQRHLQSKGYKILDTNIRNSAGEIDIVAVKDNQLFFVEVKTRKHTDYGLPEEYVNKAKLNRIKRAGLLYKTQNLKKTPDLLRVLVIGVLVENKNIEVKLIEVY